MKQVGREGGQRQVGYGGLNKNPFPPPSRLGVLRGGLSHGPKGLTYFPVHDFAKSMAVRVDAWTDQQRADFIFILVGTTKVHVSSLSMGHSACKLQMI